MRDAITLTADECNQLLALLSELPIKYLAIVQAVQAFLDQRFRVTNTSTVEALVEQENAA